jgi:hypothetical protein
VQKEPRQAPLQGAASALSSNRYVLTVILLHNDYEIQSVSDISFNIHGFSSTAHSVLSYGASIPRLAGSALSGQKKIIAAFHVFGFPAEEEAAFAGIAFSWLMPSVCTIGRALRMG